ncbi:MAG: hypothetical protein Q9M33_04730 [Robiginitomaculum sp.]|nr:hypothetical protein [Robiginitomaculum sp.]MDQ7076572.1 hypothetical protein [Robiginitomaculum sp.]
MLRLFPLLSVPVILYNVVALGGGVFSRAAEDVVAGLARTLTTVPMASGTVWVVSSGDVILMVALLMVFLELLKVAKTSHENALSHILSLGLFIICLVEFLLVPAFASTLFFAITMMTLMKVLAGYMMTGEPAEILIDDEEDYED